MMILTDKQYGGTADMLAKFRTTLSGVKESNSGEQWHRDLIIDALQAQISELEKDMKSYQLLKSGELTVRKPKSIKTLSMAIIQARIASGMSQAELAKTLGIEEMKLRRYEAYDYIGTNLATLIKVAHILNVNTTELFERESSSQGIFHPAWKNIDAVPWDKFPAREMIRRKWFDDPGDENLTKVTKAYFLKVAETHFELVLSRKSRYGVTSSDEYALIAWQVRILERACAWIEKWKLPEFVLDRSWLPELIALTGRPDGLLEARRLLSSKGIALIAEKHLPGTYLDGAVMFSPTDHPVIGLTLRSDRVDEFWFVLFHELGHLFLHLFGGMRYDFFDESLDDITIRGDKIEQEADEFAFNALIPEDQWEQCLSRFSLSEQAVQLDAERLKVDESILAGRIRKEQGNSTILDGLIRSGVREQLLV